MPRPYAQVYTHVYMHVCTQANRNELCDTDSHTAVQQRAWLCIIVFTIIFPLITVIQHASYQWRIRTGKLSTGQSSYGLLLCAPPPPFFHTPTCHAPAHVAQVGVQFLQAQSYGVLIRPSGNAVTSASVGAACVDMRADISRDMCAGMYTARKVHRHV